jgi:hypothetical protein
MLRHYNHRAGFLVNDRMNVAEESPLFSGFFFGGDYGCAVARDGELGVLGLGT